MIGIYVLVFTIYYHSIHSIVHRKISTKNFPKTQTTARTTTGTIITNFYLRLTKRDGDQRDMVKSRNCLCVAPLLPAPLVAQS